MARNSELIRQWEILREIDGARTGIAVAKLASMQRVHQRTIRRDVDALCRAGFPLYDDKVNGTKEKGKRKKAKGKREKGKGKDSGVK
jgi:predicted DNA-binding transcriptional regulator YafY